MLPCGKMYIPEIFALSSDKMFIRIFRVKMSTRIFQELLKNKFQTMKGYYKLRSNENILLKSYVDSLFSNKYLAKSKKKREVELVYSEE